MTIALSLVACTGRVHAPDPEGSACPRADSLPRWTHGPAGDVREVRVWMDTASQPLDGWSTYGWRRLRAAMTPWNALQLPVRFVEAKSGREADVIVSILDRVPGTGSGREGDQAGITNLTFSAQHEILRAHVFVATATPNGRRLRLAAQEAYLLHELGHALGLPHSDAPTAVMSAQSMAGRLVAADYALARAHYARCAS